MTIHCISVYCSHLHKLICTNELAGCDCCYTRELVKQDRVVWHRFHTQKLSIYMFYIQGHHFLYSKHYFFTGIVYFTLELCCNKTTIYWLCLHTMFIALIPTEDIFDRARFHPQNWILTLIAILCKRG